MYVILVNTRIDHVLELIVHVWCARNIELVVGSYAPVRHADWVMGFDDALDITHTPCHLCVNLDNGVDRVKENGCGMESLSDHVSRVAELTCVTLWAGYVLS